MKTQIRKIDTTLAAALLCVFAVMLVFNFLTPLTADDFVFKLNQETYEPMGSLAELAQSLSAHWTRSNGRVLAHFFAQIFLLLPKPVFNIVNAANSALLVWLIARFIRSEDKRRNGVLLAALLMLLWVLTPAFGQVFLWLTGACNYTWCTSLSLLFLLPYFEAYMGGEDGARKSRVLRCGLVCLLGFAAGSYSENGAFAMLTVSFCLMALTALRQRRVDPELLLPFVFACAGFLCLMLAPSELGTKNNGISDGVGPALITRLTGLLERLVSSGLVPILLLAVAVMAVIAVLLYRRNRKLFYIAVIALTVLTVLAAMVVLFPHDETAAGLLRQGKLLLSDVKEGLLLVFGIWAVLMLLGLCCRLEIRTLIAAGVLGLGAMASIGIFVVASYFPARSACQATFYTVLADGLLLSGLWEKGRGKTRKIFGGILAVLFVGTFALGSVEIMSSYRQNRQREELIAQALAAGEPYLMVEQIEVGSKYSAIWANESQTFSSAMAKVYGFREFWILGLDYYQDF